MQKNVIKTALISLLPLSLFSCWNNFGTQTQEKKLPEISILLSSDTASPLSGSRVDEVKQAIKAYTQTDVEFFFITRDIYDHQIAEVLENPADMPMIMYFPKLSYDVADAAKNGAFWDLADFLNDTEKFPNLSKIKHSVSQSLSIEGSLIGIPRAEDIGLYGLSYRKDWAEKLGLETPKTYEDVYNMLYEFTNSDPDGNGKNDTYGLSLSKDELPLDIIQSWFGCGNGWIEVNGALAPVHQTQEYLSALNFIKQLNYEHLIISDWPNRSSTTWKNQIIDGRAGVFIGKLDDARQISDQFATKNIRSVVDYKKYAEMVLVGAINGKTSADIGYDGFIAITHTAKTRAQVEECLHFLDKMNDPEMMILASYGLKDFNYLIDEEGFLLDIDVGNPEIAKCYSGLSKILTYTPNLLRQITPRMKISEREIEEEKVITRNAQYAVMNPASSYLASSNTYAKYHIELDRMIDVARTQYILGELSESMLSAEYNRWYERGGKDVIAEVNSLYKVRKH